MTSRIDTHHHVVPPFYADWLRSRNQLAGGWPIPDWDPAAAVYLMDRHEIATSILSISTPGTFLGDPSEAASMARDVNDYAAQQTRDFPGRFGFFATLPLPDVDASLAEIDRAFDTLDADGVVLLANHDGVYLGDPRFDAVFDELQRRKAVVFVHPSSLPGLEPLEGIPSAVADFLLDTTRAALNLARSGTLDRCPDVRVLLSHGGGFLPYAGYRLCAAASSDNNVLEGLARLGQFYFDTALSSSPSSLPSLLAFAKPGHITFGTDFPYAPDIGIAAFADMYETYDLDERTRLSIDSGAASSLFPRFANPKS